MESHTSAILEYERLCAEMLNKLENLNHIRVQMDVVLGNSMAKEEPNHIVPPADIEDFVRADVRKAKLDVRAIADYQTEATNLVLQQHGNAINELARPQEEHKDDHCDHCDRMSEMLRSAIGTIFTLDQMLSSAEELLE